MSNNKPVLVLYGATSFTARQLLTYLDEHPQGAEFDFILAGRNQERLEALNAKLSTKREIFVCELSNEDGVVSMVDRANVVVNLAGPYRRYNAEAIIRACCKAGKHYVDLCGESTWLKQDIIPKYHSLARSTGACIVPSCGFDSVPSDLTVYLAEATIKSVNRDLFLSKSTSIFKFNGSIAGGTVQTLLAVTELPPKDQQMEEYDLCPGITLKSTLPFLTTSIPETAFSPCLRGMFFFMYPYNRNIVRRTQYLTGTLSNDLPGKAMQYKEGMDVGKSLIKSALSTMVMGIAVVLFLKVKFVRQLMLRFLPKSGEGAPLEKLKAGHWRVTNYSLSETSSANAEEPVKVLTKMSGEGDPGYLSTAYMLAESALSLVLPAPQGTSLPPLFKSGGVLTPVTAMGNVLIERLKKSGKFTISSEVIPTDKKTL
ncbi:hypothetical protein L204_104840 [Cryptococcus depauperatus]|nr:saccharopine dehydrogenase [Cryptococcus depauperatus CBS 7855]